MKGKIKLSGWKELLLLFLPVLAFACWAFISSRPKPPIPFDKPHVEQEVLAQVTKQLKGLSWRDSNGVTQLTFKEVNILPAQYVQEKDFFPLVLRPDSITIFLLISCEARVPADISTVLKLTRHKPSSRFEGKFHLSGQGDITVSFPVATNTKS